MPSARRPDAEVMIADLARGHEAVAHLGSGYGLHLCLGSPLARLETQVAIGALVCRCPGLRCTLPISGLTYSASTLGRGLTALPVAMEP